MSGVFTWRDGQDAGPCLGIHQQSHGLDSQLDCRPEKYSNLPDLSVDRNVLQKSKYSV